MKTITLVAGLLAAASVHANVIDFGIAEPHPTICTSNSDGSGALIQCGNFDYLSQTYGDVAGVIDVSYSSVRNATASMRWWAYDYNSLYGVAWADFDDGNSQARIELRPLQPGAVVTLNSFDLGAYVRTTRGTHIRVFEIGGGPALWSYDGDVGNGNDFTSFAPGVGSANGLWIEFADSAYNVGIDNINYSLRDGNGQVPEPSIYALLSAGLLAAAAVARRRRS
jgi:hypothetical protein